MSLAYLVMPDDGLAVWQARGVVSGPEIRAAGRSLFQDPAWRPGLDLVADYRPARGFDLDLADLELMVEQDRGFAARLEGMRCAVVMPDDLGFGLARAWEALVGGLPYQGRAFRSLEAAAAWLGRPAETLEQALADLSRRQGDKASKTPGFPLEKASGPGPQRP